MLRKISATYVYPIHRPPIRNGIVICTPEGKVLDIIDNQGKLTEQHGIEFYSGILVPGFVNTHCHLELSGLNGKIPKETGLSGFLHHIHLLRDSEDQNQHRFMQAYDRKMWAEGIAAVGDISNTGRSLPVKKESKIFYHTFAEAFGVHPSRAVKAFGLTKEIQSTFDAESLQCSISPHSAYSVSDDLFELISANAVDTGSILSIHHQESMQENEFVNKGTGAIADHFRNNIGVELPTTLSNYKDSTERLLDKIPVNNQLVLVHNTYMNLDNARDIIQKREKTNTFFCLCPSSNLHIESQLPDLNMMTRNNLDICLGTDSLASNSRLSILKEMKVLKSHFAVIDLLSLLKWATINGARALGIEDRFGTIEEGKTPGLNLLSGLDLKNHQLLPGTKVKRLL